MRMFMPLLALVCSLHLGAVAPQEPKQIEIDLFDYNGMLQISSAILANSFGSRIKDSLEQGGDVKLVPADDQEKEELIAAFAYFLIAIARMHQEVACLLEQETGINVINSAWEQGSSIFGLMPEELQRSAVGMAMEWIEEHAEDAWEPIENQDHYKVSSDIAALRLSAAQSYHQFLGQALEEA